MLSLSCQHIQKMEGTRFFIPTWKDLREPGVGGEEFSYVNALRSEGLLLMFVTITLIYSYILGLIFKIIQPQCII